MRVPCLRPPSSISVSTASPKHMRRSRRQASRPGPLPDLPMVNVGGPYINLHCFFPVHHLRPRYPCAAGNWPGGCILSVKTFTRWEALSMTINTIALAASDDTLLFEIGKASGREKGY